MSGELEPDLHFDPIPGELDHIMLIYSAIGNPDYQEVLAYQDVTGVKLKEFEIECLRAIEKARS